MRHVITIQKLAAMEYFVKKVGNHGNVGKDVIGGPQLGCPNDKSSLAKIVTFQKSQQRILP